MKIEIKAIEKLLEGILVNEGLNKKEAEIVAEDYLTGELEGKKSHGLLAFPSIIARIKVAKGKEPIVEKDDWAYVLINAHGALGQLVAEKARALVIKKAQQNSIAIVGIYNMLPFLRPGTQAKKIAEKGLIGIVLINGGQELIAPTGSIDPILATNPIGIGIPTKSYPIVADFATAKKAWGEVRLAQYFGHKLPKKTFLDREGLFTTHPDRAYSVVPSGDYKGFILALLVEILTGSLVNMPMGKRQKIGDYRVATRGALFIAIDPKKFTDFKKFCSENSKLIKQIKKPRKAKGVKEILIPGERARKNTQKIKKRGYFEVNKRLYKEILSLA